MNCLLLGIVLLEGYKKGRPFVAPEDDSAAGMQGQPQTVDEMLDSQAEERFFQCVFFCEFTTFDSFLGDGLPGLKGGLVVSMLDCQTACMPCFI